MNETTYNKNLVNSLLKIVKHELFTEVDSFNETMQNSAEWKARQLALDTDDQVIVLLNSHIEELKKLQSLQEVDSSEYTIIRNTIDCDNSNIDERKTAILRSEFGLIEKWEIFEYIDEYIGTKLMTMDISDADATILIVKEYIKNRFQIYI